MHEILSDDMAMPIIASYVISHGDPEVFDITYNQLISDSKETADIQDYSFDSIIAEANHNEDPRVEITVEEDRIAANGVNMFARAYKIIRNRPLISTAIDETKDSSRLDRVLLATTIASYINDIGPGTEWATAKIGKEFLEMVAEYGNVPLTAAVVGLSVATFGAVYNLLTGLNMNRNLRIFPKTIDIISKSKFGKSNILMNSRNRSRTRRFTNVYTVGAASVNLEDSITDPNFVTENKGIKRTLGSTALVATGSLIVGSIAGGSIQYALNENNPELGYRILGHLTNPLIWFGLFALGRTIDYQKNKRANSSNSHEA